jgi:hypothetical protein
MRPPSRGSWTIGVGSLVGMPTPNTALALTFWALVVWYDLLVEA